MTQQTDNALVAALTGQIPNARPITTVVTVVGGTLAAVPATPYASRNYIAIGNITGVNCIWLGNNSVTANTGIPIGTNAAAFWTAPLLAAGPGVQWYCWSNTTAPIVTLEW